MRFSALVFALMIGLFFVAVQSVQACSCVGTGAPCQAFWNTPAVFSGQVEEVKTIIPESVLADGRKVYGPNRRVVRISVIEGFRGIEQQKSVETHTGGGGGDCGYDFQTGQKYLIYAYKNPETGTFETNICTRTMPLVKATEDLEYFRSLATAKPGARIFGHAYQTFPRRNDDPYSKPKPLAGMTINVEGEGGKFETKTGEDGRFEFTNLAAGEYKIDIRKPENMWGHEKPGTINVHDKGCAAYAFVLQVKTFLSGRLLNEKSEPAAKVSVEMVPIDQVNQSRHYDLKFAYTDDEGKFLFRSIPPGKYYLGIRLSGMAEILFPYPQTFYPGTTDLTKAQVISIEEGQILENFNFKLPSKLRTRTIRGIVVYPDGTPAANASLSINETEYFYSFLYRGVGNTKPDGTFSFEIVDGIRYLVKPVVSATDTPSRQRHAEPIELPANGDVTDLKFVITEPNGNCEKCLRWARNKK